ncbi:hemerythrin domain-containing protein [Chitiniphilus purpureus]|uniref:Hemerythrin domain-containing protein n=1 Tax=Chitiniphilus purpureus TaxID=2981137 RepID=A0ABY6DLA1_9NEIS|nr:hemerythrin domain-containing protein [Chitiniphilus sp. CD1]UXY15124.1 hemerythrin domain-containing protein [Chitiniphilus sp. CD1]
MKSTSSSQTSKRSTTSRSQTKSSATTATRSRSSGTQAKRATRSDAVKSLKDDHARVKKLFQAFQAAKEKGAVEEKTRIAAETCMELKIHTQLEEEIFYPALRAALREEGELLDEAEIEHASAKELIAQLEGNRDVKSTRYDALYMVLSEYVQHHVKEEEKEMFAKARSAKSLDLQALGETMAQRREELMAEYGQAAGARGGAMH